MHFGLGSEREEITHLQRNSQEVDLNCKRVSCQGASANPSCKEQCRAIVLLAENIHAARTAAKEKLAWKLASKKILLK